MRRSVSIAFEGHAYEKSALFVISGIVGAGRTVHLLPSPKLRGKFFTCSRGNSLEKLNKDHADRTNN